MKRFLLCFLVALLFSLCISVNVEASDFEKGECCNVKLSVDDKSIDLSSVVLDVYSAECTYSEPGVGTYYYSEYYNNSLNFDLNGSVSVEKPSENFLVSVNLDTLPDGYGVCPNSYFFQNGIDEFTFELKRISSIDINHGDSYSVNRACDVDMDVATCFDENGQFIFANPKIIKRDFVLLNKSCITNDAEKDLSLEYVYNVKVGGKEYLVNKQYSLHCSNKVAKAESLFKLGIISEHEYMNTLASFMLYGDQYMDEDNIIECGTSFYMTLYNYREKHKDKRVDYSLIDKVLQHSNEFQKITRSVAYLDSPSGKFRIYYDTSNANYDYNDVYNMGLLFDGIDNYFCGTLGFTRPFNPATTKYLIYLVASFTLTGPSTAKACTVYSSGTSHIEIKDIYVSDIANGTGLSAYPNCYKGIAAHEYMHAIMYAKGIISETWLHESIASWAGIQYVFNYRVTRSGAVNNFLLTSNQSLETVDTSNSRHYGSCVFPLYISSNLGINVIKKIVNSYSSSTGAIAAVSSGLSYYGSSLADAYAECAARNYDADYFYNTGLSGSYYAWGGPNPSSYSTYPAYTSKTLPHLSSDYVKYNGIATPKTLTINVVFVTVSGSPVAGIRAVRTVGSGQNYIAYPTIISNQCTIVQQNFGSSIAEHYTIIPMNVATSGNLSYTAYAQVS